MKILPPSIGDVDTGKALDHLLGLGGEVASGVLDMGFRPRQVQRDMFRLLREYHNAVVVFHRRAGKTRGLLQWVVDCALKIETKGRPEDAPPRFIYCAPTETQAMRIAWQYLVHIADKIPGAVAKRSKPAMVVLPNGAMIEVVGAHNPDNVRGTYVDGVILDEYAYINPDIYHSVLLPQLLDYNGWVILCSTPAGRNDFYRRYQAARSGVLGKSWGAMKVSVEESGVFSPTQRDAIRASLVDDEEAYEREFLCNFDAPIKGAIWGNLINKLREDGKVCAVPHDPTRKVITSWDLGIRDDTAIWFWQLTVGGQCRIINYMSASGVATHEWIKRVNDLPYDYEVHVLPHDSRKRSADSLTSFETHMQRARMRTYVLPKESVQSRIDAGRQVLGRCIFDEERTTLGVDALSLYQRKYNAETDSFERTPKHDWTSHAADAFGYGALYVSQRLGMRTGESRKSVAAAATTARDIDKLLKGKPDRPPSVMSGNERRLDYLTGGRRWS